MCKPDSKWLSICQYLNLTTGPWSPARQVQFKPRPKSQAAMSRRRLSFWLYLSYPILILQIPDNSLAYPTLECVTRLPTQFLRDLGSINRVSSIVASAVLDESDQLP